MTNDLPARLRRAATYALMDAARATVLEAADALERGTADCNNCLPGNQPEIPCLRDTFAAAALTGLLGSGDLVIDPRNGTATTLTVLDAYRWADAMLRERSPTGQKVAESDSLRAACTDHDAVPAATAPADSHAPRGAVDRESVGTDKAEPLTRDCGTGNTTDRPQPVKDSDFDRSKPIRDARLAALEELSALDQELELEHGITGNPMIKPQVNNHPEPYAKRDEKRILYDTKSPRNGALSGCETVPDPDSRVWETPCTPQPHATPQRGSVQGEGSFRVSQNANEPVAWHINGSEYDTGCEYEYATLERGIAEAATAEGCVVVPLYRHPQPTLTDEEREAVEHFAREFKGPRAATLRKLLERLA